MPLSSGQGRVIIRWAMASQNVSTLIEFGRNVQLASMTACASALDSIRVGKGKGLGTVGKGTKAGRQSASADGNKGQDGRKGQGDTRPQRHPVHLLHSRGGLLAGSGQCNS